MSPNYVYTGQVPNLSQRFRVVNIIVKNTVGTKCVAARCLGRDKRDNGR